MAKRRAPDVGEPAGFIMTPMIDVTFQLLVFFMLVLDMSTKKIEELMLPQADEAMKEKQGDPSEVIVNVKGNGNITIDGKLMVDFVKKPEAATNLENYFKNRRGVQKYWFDPSGKFVNYPLLIRADRSADWIHVQKVMMIASQLGGVYRVELGAKMVKKE